MTDEIISINTEQSASHISSTRIEVPTFKILPENDYGLYQQLDEFDFSNPPVNPMQFASSLVETCKQYRGLALSANQCGFPYRVFVAGHEDNYVAYFNPKVLVASVEEKIGLEGCLSYPNLFLNINRPETIQVEYQDYNGDKHTAVFQGMTARVFMHELDHMNGIIFTQRAKPLALKSGIDKRNKLMRKYEKYAKSLQKQVRNIK